MIRLPMADALGFEAHGIELGAERVVLRAGWPSAFRGGTLDGRRR